MAADLCAGLACESVVNALAGRRVEILVWSLNTSGTRYRVYQ